MSILPSTGRSDPLAEQSDEVEAHRAKAAHVLGMFRNAQLKPNFGDDFDTIEEEWAAPLNQFSVEVLTLAVNEFTIHNAETTAIPTIGLFLATCRATAHDKFTGRRPKGCNLHESPRFPNIEWPGVDGFVPCPACCPRKHALWKAGHLNPEHRNAGGCEQCRYYSTPWHQISAADRRNHDEFKTDDITDVHPPPEEDESTSVGSYQEGAML